MKDPVVDVAGVRVHVDKLREVLEAKRQEEAKRAAAADIAKYEQTTLAPDSEADRPGAHMRRALPPFSLWAWLRELFRS